MYWAKDLKVDGSDEDTLNYNIRILGRRGVLILNAVAGMSQLAQIEQASPEILKLVEFSEGHRYADFNPKTDKVAAYGLAALVAGGVGRETGLVQGAHRCRDCREKGGDRCTGRHRGLGEETFQQRSRRSDVVSGRREASTAL